MSASKDFLMDRLASDEKRVSEIDIMKIRDLYVMGQPQSYIAETFRIKSTSVLALAVKHGWVQERIQNSQSVVAEYLKDKSKYMSAISGLSLQLILRSLSERSVDPKPMSLHEARIVSEIFSQLDKIIKLDSGQATEHVQHLSVTLQDIKNALTKDRFIDVLPTHKGDSNESNNANDKTSGTKDGTG